MISGRLQKVPTRLWLGKFWCFILVVVYGGGRLLEIVTRSGSTVRHCITHPKLIKYSHFDDFKRYYVNLLLHIFPVQKFYTFKDFHFQITGNCLAVILEVDSQICLVYPPQCLVHPFPKMNNLAFFWPYPKRPIKLHHKHRHKLCVHHWRQQSFSVLAWEEEGSQGFQYGRHHSDVRRAADWDLDSSHQWFYGQSWRKRRLWWTIYKEAIG